MNIPSKLSGYLGKSYEEEIWYGHGYQPKLRIVLAPRESDSSTKQKPHLDGQKNITSFDMENTHPLIQQVEVHL